MSYLGTTQSDTAQAAVKYRFCLRNVLSTTDTVELMLIREQPALQTSKLHMKSDNPEFIKPVKLNMRLHTTVYGFHNLRLFKNVVST